jgi:hypothetical protein
MSKILQFQSARTDDLSAEALDEKVRVAIAARRLLQFDYGGCRRIVEPHDYGVIKDIRRLLVYQRSKVGSIGTQAIGWRLLDFHKIVRCVVLEDRFAGTRESPEQQPYDWDVLYARVANTTSSSQDRE